MFLRASRISDFDSCGVLDAVFFLAAFAERAAVEADDRRMTEVRVDAVEARRRWRPRRRRCSPKPWPSP